MTLPNTGAPDEHGLQPLDGLFSSPERAQTPRVDQTGELDMDLECKFQAHQTLPPRARSSELTRPASGPGPSTVLAAQKARLQLPRGRSPAKTHLQSPALKNPHLGPMSSPSRGSIMRARDYDDGDESDEDTVSRRLELQKGGPGGRKRMSNGARRPGQRVMEEEEEEDEDEVLRVDAVGGDDSMQLVQDHSPPPVEDSPPPDVGGEEDEVEENVQPEPKKPRGRPRGRPAKKAPPKQKEPSPEPEESEAEHEEPPVEENGDDDEEDEVPAEPPRKPGRPPKKAAPAAAATKRRSEADDAEPDGRGKKRQKTQAKAPPAAKKPAPKAKAKAKPKPKARQEPDPDASLMQVQRGPPLPRARGLVSMRADAGVQQTRSGRRSYKPLEYWKGERVEYETADVREDMFRTGSRMVLPSVKEVYRVEEEEEKARTRRRGRGKAKGSKRREAPAEEEPEEELEEWEVDPGAVSGDIILWHPDHEANPPGADEHVEVAEDRLAISSEAIQTHDIHDGTFRFAKTLNLSFMGSGVVDLPPGAEKRPKNSRKMQMVFFVFKGKVLVSVNETEFRISAGGQWFVPRGELTAFLFPPFLFGCSVIVLGLSSSWD